MPNLSQVHIFAYALVAGLLVITPGSDMLLVVSSALRGRVAAGILTASGICIGAFTWALLAGLGLIAILQANQLIFDALTLAGIGYMLYIGFIEIRAGLGPLTKGRTVSSAPTTSVAGYIRKGLITNLMNPKVGVFYIAFLPQFIEVGHVTLGNVLLLGGVHILIGFVWLSFCSIFVDRAQLLLKSPRVAHYLMLIAGVIIIALAIAVLWARFFAHLVQ